ncbi:MDS1 and EVI1 complex locus protein EVI1-A-like [Ylistrum balloti]|uniref:MDS1 and EVI1 complex locus protein EVI1-A-like n=1 Tax=Ylistrum balloti TaxID=509963 RepID=UPI0029059E71|nr:MDS1 and EVI1 complex locus protein EVI1-A-like [Ylistrum balloti]
MGDSKKKSQKSWRPSIPCILCGKCYTTMGNLRRHVNNIHGNRSTFYRCKICKTTFGRMDNYEKHLRNMHPFYKVEPEIMKDVTREQAKPPAKWNRPAESLTKKQLELAKFKVKPATGVTSSGPASRFRPVLEEAVDLLKQDLFLSDSSDSESEAEGKQGSRNHRDLAYLSSSTHTICLDEKEY